MDQVDWNGIDDKAVAITIPVWPLLMTTDQDEFRVWILASFFCKGLDRPVKWNMRIASQILELNQKKISAAIKRLETRGWLTCDRSKGLVIETDIPWEKVGNRSEVLKKELANQAQLKRLSSKLAQASCKKL